MSNSIVKVLKAEYLTHNVKRFVVEKPAGYNFIPGQATDLAINQPGLETELRPFTFTSLNESDYLEFVIKIYTGHDGVTEKLSLINEGDELIIHDVFGTIGYKGPGLFIAGGAGITPFISIFRELKRRDKLAGNTLLFANREPRDIILKDELTAMLGKNHLDILEKPLTPGVAGAHINKALLKQHLGDSTAYYYICGPDKFTSLMIENLLDLGVKDEQLVFEQ